MKSCKKPSKTLEKQREKLFVVKISERLCKRSDTVCKITPVDVKCKALVATCKLLKKFYYKSIF